LYESSHFINLSKNPVKESLHGSCNFGFT